MLHPFAPLTTPLLHAFVKAGKKYFVRQTYTRGNNLLDDSVKEYFILTHYDEIGQAQHHISALQHDPRRRLYEWDRPKNQQKLLVAANSPAGYKIFSGVFVKDWKKLITNDLKGKIKKYIDYNIGWIPGRGETVQFEALLIMVNFTPD